MFSLNDTILIIGRSDYLVGKEEKIAQLTRLYNTIGINMQNPLYNLKYIMFMDYWEGIIEKYKGKNSKPIVLTSCVNAGKVPSEFPVIAFQEKVISSINNRPYIDNQLCYAGFTHDVAISFAIHQGYKNIILIGAADFSKYHSDYTKFKRSQRLEELSIDLIERVYKRYANLYTINPDSRLKHIPKITTERLISEFTV